MLQAKAWAEGEPSRVLPLCHPGSCWGTHTWVTKRPWGIPAILPCSTKLTTRNWLPLVWRKAMGHPQFGRSSESVNCSNGWHFPRLRSFIFLQFKFWVKQGHKSSFRAQTSTSSDKTQYLLKLQLLFSESFGEVRWKKCEESLKERETKEWENLITSNLVQSSESDVLV